MLHVPLMVSVDKRGVHDLLLPGLSTRAFRGVSLAELLDDVALHLMEVVPSMTPETLRHLRLCPDIELRRVKTTARIGGTDRKPVLWTGRLSVVVTRWKDDRFFTCTVPRLGTTRFAVHRTAALELALSRFVTAWAEDRALDPEELDRLTCRSYEYIEVLEVDAELPSVLPSRPPKRKKKKSKARGAKARAQKKRGDKTPRKRRLVPPMTLRQVGVDLTHKAIDGRLGRTFGRDDLVAEVMRQLDRPGAAILLVGASGVGKTAIVHEVVRRLAAEGKPLHQRTDVWAVDGNRIIAGMSLVGAWEKRCKDMVGELEARDDVLFVDDLPALVYTGRTRQADTNVAEYLEPHIARGEIRIIGECTPERLEASREEAPGFFSRFQVIQVPPLDEARTLMVLVDTLRAVEAREAVVIEPEVLEAILALTRRFQRRQCHPGKAVSLLERLVTDYGEVRLDDRGRRIIGRSQLVDFFSRRTGLPRFVLWEQQSRPFDEVHAHFSRRIIGQPSASRTSAEVVCVLQQGLDDPERPMATMLFVGPTGVGKTETAKALAEYLFGSAERLIRFDMSEFRDAWSMSRLFGDRLRPEGELTRRVAQQPFSVVLFDEIEKAHPRVFDAFLQVFGEGRLTNAAGRTTDFCNTILIMTSNLGVREAQRGLGFTELGGTRRDAHYRKAAEGFFRPEFFNRIDRIVPFRNLERDDLGPLIKRTLEQILARRGLRRSGVMVQVEPELIELLVDQGFDPRYGARSLRRALEQRLTVPLARQLVTQPVDRTTLVSLYRAGDDIGMRLWGLLDRPVEAKPLPRLRDWATLRSRVAAARQQLEAVLDGEALARRESERTELLKRFNAGTLDAIGWGRLNVLNGLLEPSAEEFGYVPVSSIADVRQALDRIQEDYLERYEYYEDIELVAGYDKDYGYVHPTAAVGTELPHEVNRGAQFNRAAGELAQVESVLAGVSFRAQALEQPAEQVLMRLLAGTEEPESRGWTRRLTLALSEALRRWADVKIFVRTEGAWHQATRDGRLPEWEDDVPLEAVDGMALALDGQAIGGLVQPELGFHLDTRFIGADLVCGLCRVERLEGADAPLPRLTAADAAFARFRAARRQGRPIPSPRPQLPVVRRFRDDVATDPTTGLTLDRARMGEGLTQVIDHRLLIAHRESVASTREEG